MKIQIPRFILFLVCSIALRSYSQTNEFAPIGATWWYNYEYFSGSGYLQLQSVGDTVIGGVNCRKITKTLVQKDLSNPDAVVDTFYLDNEYVYSDLGVVYNYRLNSFYTLYDFSAAIHDTWEVGGVSNFGDCDSTGFIQVDNVNTVLMGGVELTQLFTSSVDDDYWNFGTLPVIERIGSLSYLFAHPNSCLIDFYEGGNLRCYYDNEIGYVQIDSTTTCDFVLSSNEIPVASTLAISPNPFSSVLNIKLPDNYSNSIITIYNLNGSILYQTTTCNSTIDISTDNLIPGVYLLYVLDNHIQYHCKIIKL